MTDEVRMFRHLDKTLDFVKVVIHLSDEVTMVKTKDGYIVKVKNLR